MGTIQECAQHMGVLPETVYFYTTQAYQRRLSERKNPRIYLTVTELEED
ncbi:hypothetical protein COL91_28890 [Bacillus pseudomycoides]|nr:hypothetical protein COO02_26895 [Bacillus pseudomycoides]PEI84642.1 hypothetical protein CN679_25680 [Bacillus pseudomycoides]PGA78148.1 hypothetical protein COL91_28890 [Bacillus pseudomycoides]